MKRILTVLVLLLFTMALITSAQAAAGDAEIATWGGFSKAAVSFTFDDGAPSHISDVAPLFDKYFFKATFYLVTNWNPDWSGFQGLANNGHEIGSHSDTHGINMAYQEASSKKNINNHITQKYGMLTVAYPNNTPSGNGDFSAAQQNYIAGRVFNGDWQNPQISSIMNEDGPDNWFKLPAIMTGHEGTNDFIGTMQDAVKQGGWVAFVTHGISGKNNGNATYSPTDLGTIEEALKWAQQNAKEIWVAPLGYAAMYIKERNASTITLTYSGTDYFTYTLTHEIADDICQYNYPLSIRVALPDGISKAKVFQSNIELESKVDGGYVYFDAVPNGGDISITYEKTTTVKVSKVDSTDNAALAGATIQLLDKDDRFVTQWDSGSEAHIIEGLKIGTEYTLKETVAPVGFTIATPVKFSVDENGNISSTGTVTEEGILLIKDHITRVKISAIDIADGKELAGATLQILDSEGNIVDEWVSSSAEAHEITGLNAKDEYTLKETVAPEGYTIASAFTFYIDEKTGKIFSSGTVTTDNTILIENSKTSIKVSKVDIADGKELAGATLQILDSEGNIVDEWVSTEKAYEITGLITGAEYTLREAVAPEGYSAPTDLTFTINEDGKITAYGATITDDGILLVEGTRAPDIEITIQVDPTNSGKVLMEGKETTGGTFPGNTSIILTAEPNDDYYFVKWTVDGKNSSSNKKFTFKKEADCTIVAHFAKKAEAAATIKANTLTYDGTDQELVSCDPKSLVGGTVTYSLEKDGTYTSSIPKGKDAKSYTVYYKIAATDDTHKDSFGKVDVKISPRSITITANNQSYPYNGDERGEANVVYNNSTVITRKIKVDNLTDPDAAVTSIKLKGVAVDAGLYEDEKGIMPSDAVIIRNGTDVTKNYFITYVPGKLTITPIVSVTADPSDGGTAEITAINGKAPTGDETFMKGDKLKIRAEAKPGWFFSGWTDNGLAIDAEAEYQFTLGNAAILIAHFTKMNSSLTITKETITEVPADGFALGDEIECKITIENTGNVAISHIVVTDTLTGDEWTIGLLNPNESQELFSKVYTVTEADIIAGSVINKASAKGTSPDPNSPEVTADATVSDNTEKAKSELTVTKTTDSVPKDPKGFGPGETISYKITVENTGNLTISDIVIKDDLTKEHWELSSLKPGTPAKTYETSYTVKKEDLSTGSIENKVLVTGTSADKSPVEKEASVTVNTYAEYVITWLDGDGNELLKENLAYGTTPEYTGETPTKTATAQYTYTFNGNWSPDIAPVTDDATYTAQFSNNVNDYTVTWIIDGRRETETYSYGVMPSHSSPSKPADVIYYYTFQGWSPKIVPVTGDATYTAIFQSHLYPNGPFNPFSPNKPVKNYLGETKNKSSDEEVPAHPFTDVNPLMEDVIRYVYERDIMNGVSSTLFNPYGTLNRAMVVTILHRLEGSPAVSYTATFEDVPAGEWYTQGVEWAAANGIVLGYGNGTYGPEKPVTREQLAAILHRYAEWKGYEIRTGELIAEDANQISPWAIEDVNWAVANDILWVSDGEVRPTEEALRWEVAVAIQAFLEGVAK